uniref:Thiamine biosynthesis protein n=1 Tax=Pseudo-nitzschia micropora TaxID=186175 RepID=UPI001D10F692|nr:Thiamine biosynthesis protein [Pseudo-nitzschia micropora]UBA14931.1 Thiamine biosynthesis protein [Pseudo-nitzschia micropora]
MTQIKNFFLNNEHYTTKDEINLYDLITYFDYNESLLVLEYNQVIFDKTNWKTTFIQDLDEIEIVTIVGGG